MLTRSFDLVFYYFMKTMLVSEFKAKCIGALKEANRTGEPLLVTLRGRPLARIVPVGRNRPERKLGALRGWMEIKGDIVHADFADEWESGR